MATDTKVTNITTDNDILKFTLTNVNTCYANAVRRTVISSIPIVVFQTTPHERNKCNILSNTTRLHNEIIKQRLSCIPIHIDTNHNIRNNLSNYLLELNVDNKTDTTMYATTEHFKLRDLTTNTLVDDAIVKQVFPPFVSPNGTEYYIDFVRLRPKISDELPGEKINLTCELTISTAADNSMYNVTGTCAYGCTPNIDKMEEELSIRRHKWKEANKTEEEIKFEAANWKLLEGLRYVTDNSFDFIIQTLGIYDNENIIKQSCEILRNQLEELIYLTDRDELSIKASDNILDNCYDIILENEDYTIGNILNHEIYTTFYTELKLVDFVGYKKVHPHDANSILRISLVDKTQGKDSVKTMFKSAIDRSITTVESIKRYFK